MKRNDFNEVLRKAVCLYDKSAVLQSIDRIAKEISDKLADLDPLFLVVLKGGLVAFAQLVIRLDFPMELDYVHATRYHGGKGGVVEWVAKPKTPVKDRVVVIFDDVLDKGVTLQEVLKYCRESGAKEVYTAVLIDKEVARAENGLGKADFTALHIPDRFIIGYGLDYNGYFRNLPGIFSVEEKDLLGFA